MDTNNEPKRPRGRPRKHPLADSALPKRPRGRPALGDKAKSVVVSLRISPQEYDDWQKIADPHSLSDFILNIVRRSVERRKRK